MTHQPWQPALGVWWAGGVAQARVWAPGRKAVAVVLELNGKDVLQELSPDTQGYFNGRLPLAKENSRYRLMVDGDRYPDPASRSQPEGVHGSSAIVNPARFEWHDAAWRVPPREELVLYELHMGTFTPEGSFAAARQKLGYLADLGVTALEIMPVAEFAGHHNWGYDGAALFAPSHRYGTPDDLRALVDAAHAKGLAVFLDVVYNHLGPDGTYLPAVSQRVFSDRHQTPWGPALNFDGDGSRGLRDFFIESACHWIAEYHLDGLRLDATHAIIDDSLPHFLTEFTERVRRGVDRPVYLFAEDNRNLADLITPVAEGGSGFDALWSDDFHHQLRRMLTGDHESWFAPFSARLPHLATIVERGWRFPAPTAVAARPSPSSFIFCIQNHDQVGNRAEGDRLHHRVDPAVYRAATTLLLAAPETPLLFMGQEWAASTPFQFFTDHVAELGHAVTAGRRKEFEAFEAFRSCEAQSAIPDPQAAGTFRNSVLRWDEASGADHAAVLQLYRRLLGLRRRERLLHANDWQGFTSVALDDDTLLLRREQGSAALATIVKLRGSASTVNLGSFLEIATSWRTLFSSEEPIFVDDPAPIEMDSRRRTVRFARPGALILGGMKSEES